MAISQQKLIDSQGKKRKEKTSKVQLLLSALFLRSKKKIKEFIDAKSYISFLLDKIELYKQFYRALITT